MNTNPDANCAVPNCTSNARELPIISSDPVRAKQWLAQLGIPEDAMSGKVMVCKVHFDILMSNRKQELRTLMSTDIKQDDSSDTTNDLLIPTTSQSYYIPDEAGPSNVIKKTINDDYSQQNVTMSTKNASTPNPVKNRENSKLITTIQKIIRDKTQEFREQVAFFISLKYPRLFKTYYNILGLPSVSGLKNVLDDDLISFQKYAPINKKILIHKAQLVTNIEKQCVLCISEVKVKPNLYYDVKLDKIFGFADEDEESHPPELAHLALVLTVQGIFSKWTQILAITFIGETNGVEFRSSLRVKQWILQNIRILYEVGFNVVGFVSQFKYPLSSEKQAYFDVIGYRNKKILYLNDISFLMKQFYYHFFTHNYSSDEICGTAKIEHILDYYKISSEKGLRLTPKLKERHFEVPKNIEDVNIKLVKEVISLDTARAMSQCINSEMLNKPTEATVKLISTMSKLFKILQDDNLRDAKNLSGQTQKQLLNNIITFLQNMREINKSTNEEKPIYETFMDQIILIIVSTLTLQSELRSEFPNYRAFPTKRLSLYYVTKHFDRIRNNSKDGKEPTCKELFMACKRTMYLNLLQPMNGDRDKDMDDLDGLELIKKLIISYKFVAKKGENIIGKQIQVVCSDYNTFKLKRRDDVVYIAGFILKKCFDRHKFCEPMKMYAFNMDKTSSIGQLIQNEGLQDVCLVPNEKLIDFVEMMEIKFRSVMAKSIMELSNKKLVNSLLFLMLTITFQMPCECFPLLFAKKLFLRLRIYRMLKYNRKLQKVGKFNFVI